jgi:hypothetical protein
MICSCASAWTPFAVIPARNFVSSRYIAIFAQFTITVTAVVATVKPLLPVTVTV